MSKILFFSFIFLSSAMNLGLGSKDNGTELSLPYQNAPTTNSETQQEFDPLPTNTLRPKYRRRVKKTKRQLVTIEGSGFDFSLQSPNLNQTEVEFEFPDERRNFTVEITDISHRRITNEDDKPPQYSYSPNRRTKISKPIITYDSQPVSTQTQSEQQQPPLYNQLKPRLLKPVNSFIFEVSSTQANTPAPSESLKSGTLRRPKLRGKVNNDFAAKSFIIEDPIFQKIQATGRIKSTTTKPKYNLEATTRKAFFVTRSPALVFYDDESDVNMDELNSYLKGFQSKFGSKESMTVPPPHYDDYTDSVPRELPEIVKNYEETQITQSPTTQSVVVTAPSLGTERTVSLSLSGFLPNYPVSTQSPQNDDEPYRNRQTIVSTVEKRKRTVLRDNDQPAERERIVRTQTQDNRHEKDDGEVDDSHEREHDDDSHEKDQDNHSNEKDDDDDRNDKDHVEEKNNNEDKAEDRNESVNDSITKGNTPSRAQNYYTHAQVVHLTKTPASLEKAKAREEEKHHQHHQQTREKDDEDDYDEPPKSIVIAPNVRYAPSRKPTSPKTTTTEKITPRTNNYQAHLIYSPKDDARARYDAPSKIYSPPAQRQIHNYDNTPSKIYSPPVQRPIHNYDAPSKIYSPPVQRPIHNYDDPTVRMDLLYKNGHPGVLPPPRHLQQEKPGPKPYHRPPSIRTAYESVVADDLHGNAFPHDPVNDDPPPKFDSQSDRFYGEPIPDRNPAQSSRDDPVQLEAAKRTLKLEDDPVVKEIEPVYENQQHSPPIQRREPERDRDDRREPERDRDDRDDRRDSDRDRDDRRDSGRDRDDRRDSDRDRRYRDDDREQRYRRPSYYDVPAVTAYPLSRDERARVPETDPNGYIQDFVSLDNNFDALPRVRENDFGTLLPKIPSDDAFNSYPEQDRYRDREPARSNVRPRTDREHQDYEDEHRPASSGYFDGDRNTAADADSAAYVEERDRDDREHIRERDGPRRGNDRRYDDEHIPSGFNDGYQSAGRGFGFGGGGPPPRSNLPLDPIYTRTLKQFDDEISSLQRNEGASKDYPPQPPARDPGYRNDHLPPLSPPISPIPSQIEPYKPERPERPERPEPSVIISRGRHVEPEIPVRRPKEYRSPERAAPLRVPEEEEEVTHRDREQPSERQSKEPQEEEEEEEEEEEHEPEEPENDGRHVRKGQTPDDNPEKNREESRHQTSMKNSNDKRPPPEKPQTERSGSIDDDIVGIEQEWGRVG